ncbi:MAG: PKD domain-containing protein, partial [Flavobacteriales bacterium]
MKGNASHIYGGEVNYVCLGNKNFIVTLKIYMSCLRSMSATATESVSLYDAKNKFVKTVKLPFVSTQQLPIIKNPCAGAARGTCIKEVVFSDTISWPTLRGRGTITNSTCCRNGSISNLLNPATSGQTYYTLVSDEDSLGSCNSEPIFVASPPAEMCTGLKTTIDFAAFDADGDALRYKLITPLDDTIKAPPFLPLKFAANYTKDDPMNANIKMDSLTGRIELTPSGIGLFVLAVAVEEYRNGVLIGKKIRDFTYTVVACVPSITVANPEVFSCNGSPVYFNIDFKGSLKAGSPFNWNFGEPSSGANNTSSLKDPSHQYKAPGKYFANVSVQDSCGNVVNANVKVHINENRTKLETPKSYCFGETVTLESKDSICNNLQWFLGEKDYRPTHVGCTFSFPLNKDSVCVYYEPAVDDSVYSVGASKIDTTIQTFVSTIEFEAKSSLVIDAFDLVGNVRILPGYNCSNGDIKIVVREKSGKLIYESTPGIQCARGFENKLRNLGIKIPSPGKYMLYVQGGGFFAADSHYVSNKLITFHQQYSSPFYNMVVRKDIFCAVREKVCVKASCYCPDTTLNYPTSVCGSEWFDLQSLKVPNTGSGKWSISEAPQGSNTFIVSDFFNATKSAAPGKYKLLYQLAVPAAICDDSVYRNIEVLPFDTVDIRQNVLQFCELDSASILQKSTSTSSGKWWGNGADSLGVFYPYANTVGLQKLY